MGFNFRSREEQNAIDIRNHQLKMAKIEIKKIKVSKEWDEYYVWVHFIKWSYLSLCCGALCLTICNMKPQNLDIVKENNKSEIAKAQILFPSSDKARDQMLLTREKADSIVKVNGWTTNGPQTDSQHTNAGK